MHVTVCAVGFVAHAFRATVAIHVTYKKIRQCRKCQRITKDKLLQNTRIPPPSAESDYKLVTSTQRNRTLGRVSSSCTP